MANITKISKAAVLNARRGATTPKQMAAALDINRSHVYYLMKKYGLEGFGRLCRNGEKSVPRTVAPKAKKAHPMTIEFREAMRGWNRERI